MKYFLRKIIENRGSKHIDRKLTTISCSLINYSITNKNRLDLHKFKTSVVLTTKQGLSLYCIYVEK